MVDIRQFMQYPLPDYLNKGPKIYQPEKLKTRVVVDKYGIKHTVKRVRINDHAYREYL